MFSLEDIKLNNLPFPYFVKNNILPENLALKAQEEILNIKN